jgi:Flp pilus assembly protein TadG
MRHSLNANQAGTALTEAAIVLPIFCLLVAGLFQFGYLFGIVMNLRNGAAVGARAAILGSGQTANQVCSAALASISTLVDTAQVTCQTAPASLPAPPNTAVTVTLTYPAPVLAIYAGFSAAQSWTLTAQTTMQ